MLNQFFNTVHRACRDALQIATAIGLIGLVAVSSARAVSLDPASVVSGGSSSFDPASVASGDSFSLEVVGYNTSAPSQNIYLTNQYLNPVFGTTNNYANGALGGQTFTVSSVQYLNNGIITDYIFMSVPSNFVPAGTRDNGGNAINAIQFAIGNYFVPAGITGNPLNFNPALTSYTVTGSVSFINNGVPASGAVPMTTTLTGNGTGLSTFGVLTGTASQANPSGDLSPSQINGFSIAVTYAVPEPSTYAAVALGTIGLLLVVRRRRARA